MAYEKTNWINGVTPIDEDNLNKIEDELEKLDNRESVPAGGTTGQVLTKNSDIDYDAEWQDPQGGSGDGSDTLPIGSIVDYSGNRVPDGWEQVEDPVIQEINSIKDDLSFMIATPHSDTRVVSLKLGWDASLNSWVLIVQAISGGTKTFQIQMKQIN